VIDGATIERNVLELRSAAESRLRLHADRL